MGKKGRDEQGESGAFRLPSARVKAIAQQDREMGSLNNDAVERISTAAHELLQELVRGGLKAAREREAEASAGKAGKGKAGPVTIQPEDICAFVASEERLGFLRRVTEAASQQAGFLEGYRARNKEAVDATSKKRHRAEAKALAGAEEEEEGEGSGGEYEDEEVEEAFVKDGKGPGGGNGGKGGTGKGGAALSLDEDYDDDEG